MDAYDEALVIVHDADYPQVVRAVGDVATITQSLPPRLLLVAVSLDIRHQLPAIGGASWYFTDVPADVLDQLSPQERLFVSAWAARRMKKDRPGDRLPWDAPGFEPPDWLTDEGN